MNRNYDPKRHGSYLLWLLPWLTIGLAVGWGVGWVLALVAVRLFWS